MQRSISKKSKIRKVSRKKLLKRSNLDSATRRKDSVYLETSSVKDAPRVRKCMSNELLQLLCLKQSLAKLSLQRHPTQELKCSSKSCQSSHKGNEFEGFHQPRVAISTWTLLTQKSDAEAFSRQKHTGSSKKCNSATRGWQPQNSECTASEFGVADQTPPFFFDLITWLSKLKNFYSYHSCQHPQQWNSESLRCVNFPEISELPCFAQLFTSLIKHFEGNFGLSSVEDFLKEKNHLQESPFYNLSSMEKTYHSSFQDSSSDSNNLHEAYSNRLVVPNTVLKLVIPRKSSLKDFLSRISKKQSGIVDGDDALDCNDKRWEQSMKFDTGVKLDLASRLHSTTNVFQPAQNDVQLKSYTRLSKNTKISGKYTKQRIDNSGDFETNSKHFPLLRETKYSNNPDVEKVETRSISNPEKISSSESTSSDYGHFRKSLKGESSEEGKLDTRKEVYEKLKTLNQEYSTQKSPLASFKLPSTKYVFSNEKPNSSNPIKNHEKLLSTLNSISSNDTCTVSMSIEKVKKKTTKLASNEPPQTVHGKVEQSSNTIHSLNFQNVETLFLSSRPFAQNERKAMSWGTKTKSVLDSRNLALKRSKSSLKSLQSNFSVLGKVTSTNQEATCFRYSTFSNEDEFQLGQYNNDKTLKSGQKLMLNGLDQNCFEGSHYKTWTWSLASNRPNNYSSDAIPSRNDNSYNKIVSSRNNCLKGCVSVPDTIKRTKVFIDENNIFDNFNHGSLDSILATKPAAINRASVVGFESESGCVSSMRHERIYKRPVNVQCNSLSDDYKLVPSKEQCGQNCFKFGCRASMLSTKKNKRYFYERKNCYRNDSCHFSKKSGELTRIFKVSSRGALKHKEKVILERHPFSFQIDKTPIGRITATVSLPSKLYASEEVTHCCEGRNCLNSTREMEKIYKTCASSNSSLCTIRQNYSNRRDSVLDNYGSSESLCLTKIWNGLKAFKNCQKPIRSMINHNPSFTPELVKDSPGVKCLLGWKISTTDECNVQKGKLLKSILLDRTKNCNLAGHKFLIKKWNPSFQHETVSKTNKVSTSSQTLDIGTDKCFASTSVSGLENIENCNLIVKRLTRPHTLVSVPLSSAPLATNSNMFVDGQNMSIVTPTEPQSAPDQIFHVGNSKEALFESSIVSSQYLTIDTIPYQKVHNCDPHEKFNGCLKRHEFQSRPFREKNSAIKFKYFEKRNKNVSLRNMKNANHNCRKLKHSKTAKSRFGRNYFSIEELVSCSPEDPVDVIILYNSVNQSSDGNNSQYQQYNDHWRANEKFYRCIGKGKFEEAYETTFDENFAVDWEDPWSGERPLVCAVVNSQYKIISRLLELGSILDAPDYKGRTAFLVAAVLVDCRAAGLLLSHGLEILCTAPLKIAHSRSRKFAKFLKFLELAVLAGFNMTKEIKWFETILESSTYGDKENLDKSLQSSLLYLQMSYKQSQSLAALCFLSVRRRLSKISKGRSIVSSINQLPLPQPLKMFLSMEEHIAF